MMIVENAMSGLLTLEGCARCRLLSMRIARLKSEIRHCNKNSEIHGGAIQCCNKRKQRNQNTIGADQNSKRLYLLDMVGNFEKLID